MKLYYFETPNGYKPLILLEELEVAYQPIRVDITQGENRKSDYLKISPNGKIPAFYDPDPFDGTAPVSIFESGAILLYLSQKYSRFMPQQSDLRGQTLSWLNWQVSGLGPNAGQYIHYQTLPTRIDHALKRHRDETRRLLNVLNTHLSINGTFICGSYSIADIACFPWIHMLKLIETSLFTNLSKLTEWHQQILTRPNISKILMLYPLKTISPRHQL